VRLEADTRVAASVVGLTACCRNILSACDIASADLTVGPAHVAVLPCRGDKIKLDSTPLRRPNSLSNALHYRHVFRETAQSTFAER